MYCYPGWEVPHKHTCYLFTSIVFSPYYIVKFPEENSWTWDLGGRKWVEGLWVVSSKIRKRKKEGLLTWAQSYHGAPQGESWGESVEFSVRTPLEPQGGAFLLNRCWVVGNICEMVREWGPPHHFREVGQRRERESGSLWLEEGMMVIML